VSLDKVHVDLLMSAPACIGLELGSVGHRPRWPKFTVVEFLTRILPDMDGENCKAIPRIWGKQGFAFKLGARVQASTPRADAVGQSEPAAAVPLRPESDVVLVCIGRVPYTEGAWLKEAVRADNRGRVQIDAHFSQAEGRYAIGDVVAGTDALAHKSEY